MFWFDILHRHHSIQSAFWILNIYWRNKWDTFIIQWWLLGPHPADGTFYHVESHTYFFSSKNQMPKKTRQSMALARSPIGATLVILWMPSFPTGWKTLHITCNGIQTISLVSFSSAQISSSYFRVRICPYQFCME